MEPGGLMQDSFALQTNPQVTRDAVNLSQNSLLQEGLSNAAKAMQAPAESIKQGAAAAGVELTDEEMAQPDNQAAALSLLKEFEAESDQKIAKAQELFQKAQGRGTISAGEKLALGALFLAPTLLGSAFGGSKGGALGAAVGTKGTLGALDAIQKESARKGEIDVTQGKQLLGEAGDIQKAVRQRQLDIALPKPVNSSRRFRIDEVRALVKQPDGRVKEQLVFQTRDRSTGEFQYRNVQNEPLDSRNILEAVPYFKRERFNVDDEPFVLTELGGPQRLRFDGPTAPSQGQAPRSEPSQAQVPAQAKDQKSFYVAPESINSQDDAINAVRLPPKEKEIIAPLFSAPVGDPKARFEMPQVLAQPSESFLIPVPELGQSIDTYLSEDIGVAGPLGAKALRLINAEGYLRSLNVNDRQALGLSKSQVKDYADLLKQQRTEIQQEQDAEAATNRKELIEARKAQEEANTIFANMGEVLDLKNELNTGPIQSRINNFISGFDELRGLVGQDKLQELRSRLVFNTADYLRQTSGLTVSDSERQFLLSALPIEEMDDDAFKQALSTFMSRVDLMRKRSLRQTGLFTEPSPEELQMQRQFESFEKLQELYDQNKLSEEGRQMFEDRYLNRYERFGGQQ